MDKDLIIAILNRIIPADSHSVGGEVALQHVIKHTQPREEELIALFNALGDDFLVQSPDIQDRILGYQENTPFFRALCEWTHEGYWTSKAGQDLVGFVVTG